MTAGRSAHATTWRFRRIAALYPTGWLAEHGEAYVGTMLDAADAEHRTAPTGREWLSALRHLAGVWDAEVRRRVRGDETLRSLALPGRCALVSGAALSLAALVLGEWAPRWALVGHAPAWSARHGMGEHGSGTVLFAGWLVALGVFVAGRVRTARRLLLGLAVLPALLAAVHAAGGPGRPSAGVLLALTAFAAVAAGVREGPLRGRVTLAAVAVGLAALAMCWMVGRWLAGPDRELLPVGFGFYRDAGLPALAAVVFRGVVAAAVAGLLTLRRRPGVLLAAALVGTPWLWLAVSTRAHFRPEELALQAPLVVAAVALPGVVAAALGLARTGWRLARSA